MCRLGAVGSNPTYAVSGPAARSAPNAGRPVLCEIRPRSFRSASNGGSESTTAPGSVNTAGPSSSGSSTSEFGTPPSFHRTRLIFPQHLDRSSRAFARRPRAEGRHARVPVDPESPLDFGRSSDAHPRPMTDRTHRRWVARQTVRSLRLVGTGPCRSTKRRSRGRWRARPDRGPIRSRESPAAGEVARCRHRRPPHRRAAGLRRGLPSGPVTMLAHQCIPYTK